MIEIEHNRLKRNLDKFESFLGKLKAFNNTLPHLLIEAILKSFKYFRILFLAVIIQEKYLEFDRINFWYQRAKLYFFIFLKEAHEILYSLVFRNIEFRASLNLCVETKSNNNFKPKDYCHIRESPPPSHSPAFT